MQTDYTIEKVTWQDVREKVKKANPALTAVIDDIAPGSSMYLYKATYPYGAVIMKNREMYIPDKGKISHLTAQKYPKLWEDLKYLKTIPVSLILENQAEAVKIHNNRPIPSWMFKAGHFLNLYGLLGGEKTTNYCGDYELTAGARSLFFIPSISIESKIRKFKRHFKTHVTFDTPKIDGRHNDKWPLVEQHYAIFKAVANEFSDWSMSVIFFPKAWINKIFEDTKWHRLREYFYSYSHEGGMAQYETKVIYDDIISCTLNNKIDWYLKMNLDKIYQIGYGRYQPAFILAKNDRAAPISRFQQAIVDFYGITASPQILHIGHPQGSDICYYILDLPFIYSQNPNLKNSSILEMLITLSDTMSHTHAIVEPDPFKINNTVIYSSMATNDYQFYSTHQNRRPHPNVGSITDMLLQDLNAQKCQKQFPQFASPISSPFLGGVVSIRKKTKWQDITDNVPFKFKPLK